MTITRTGRQVMLGCIDATIHSVWERLRTLLHPDYAEDYPQSGERIRGVANAIAVRSHFRRERHTSLEQRQLVGGEERWALAPNLTAIRVTGEGDTVTAVIRSKYPGGYWYVIHIAQVESGMV